MSQIANTLIEKFKKVRNNKHDAINISDLDLLLREIVVLIEDHISQNDAHIYTELKNISDKIERTKLEISGVPEGDMVEDAKLELDAVVKSTEEATNKILDCTETIQNLIEQCENAELKNNIAKNLTEIMEACNFQDLTGQRIKKVTSTLKFIENSVGDLISDFSSNDKVIKIKSEDEKLMNGPQLQERAPSQDDIDKLFNES